MSVRSSHHRRGVILPVMLMILILLGLLAATFAFRVHADYSAMNAVAYRLQTRMAAEAGIQKVLLMLRTQRADVQAWYNNPDELNRIIVWTPGDETLWGTNEEFEEKTFTYRFSIVADTPFDDEERCRYGITDESAKLNLNTASKEQLGRLISQIATEDMVVEELVDALLDYLDEDDIPRENGAESEYYSMLDTPYRAKNGPLDTVEELLMVKGFDGRVLYGEDQDRNGLLTPNEDDGDKSFPEDDSDGKLNRGLYPYVTVYSNETYAEPPQVYLYGDANYVSEQLSELFDDPAKVQFILSALRPQTGQGGEADGEGGEEAEGSAEEGDQTGSAEGHPSREGENQEVSEEGGQKDDHNRRSQQRRPGSREGGRRGGRGSAEGDVSKESGEGEGEEGSVVVGVEAPEGASSGGGQGATSQPTQLASPADLLTAATDGANPLTIDDLPVLMAGTTTRDPITSQPGLINVMTAPPQVLRCLTDLTGEEIGAIIATRAELSEEDGASTAWLVTHDVLSLEKYQALAPQITARGLQFTIESLGFADHVGTITRLQVIVEMRGPMAQVLYYRDLTSLGSVYPIREGEAEYGFGGQHG